MKRKLTDTSAAVKTCVPRAIAFLGAFMLASVCVGATGAGATTHSKFTSITPDRRQFVTQPDQVLPLAVLGGDSPHFDEGDYMVYVGPSNPHGMELSRWNTYGPFRLSGNDKWRATLRPQSKLTMERNPGPLSQYSNPGPKHAMVYVRNNDESSWQSICVLPVGWDAKSGCFGGSANVRYVPPRSPGSDTGPDAPQNSSTSEVSVIYDNGNAGAVYSQPQRSTVFTVSKPTVIAAIQNYHWNKGRGAAGGQIWLTDQSGRQFGPWPVAVQSNVYWIATPNVRIEPGTYTVHDSDRSTWSQNPGSQGAGMSQVKGYVAKSSSESPSIGEEEKPGAIRPGNSGWHLEGAPKIEKRPLPAEDACYFGFSFTISNGSASGTKSWKEAGCNRDKGGCSGKYSGRVTWTVPPSYMEPGSSMPLSASSGTTASNSCGYKNIGSWVSVKGPGLFLEAKDANPTASANFTVPQGRPGSKLSIDVTAQATGFVGVVHYQYIYR